MLDPNFNEIHGMFMEVWRKTMESPLESVENPSNLGHFWSTAAPSIYPEALRPFRASISMSSAACVIRRLT